MGVASQRGIAESLGRLLEKPRALLAPACDFHHGCCYRLTRGGDTRVHRKSLLAFVVSFLLGACLSAQTITEFALPAGTRPVEIIMGPDGHLWFTEGLDGRGQGRIGRMTTAGDVDFLRSGLGEGTFPADLTAGPDGNVWAIYGDQSSDDMCWIYRVTPSGEHTRFVNECTLTGIATGLDGNLWFTRLVGAIGRMTTADFGVRTLGAGATVTLTLRDAAGVLVTTVARVLPPTYHEQQSAAAFLGVTTLPAGGSLTVTVNAGAAIFYGATVDNTTGDPSLQIARVAP